MDEVAADTVAIIAKRVPADKRNLSMTDRLEDLNIDSFSAVEMIYDLEKRNSTWSFHTIQMTTGPSSSKLWATSLRRSKSSSAERSKYPPAEPTRARFDPRDRCDAGRSRPARPFRRSNISWPSALPFLEIWGMSELFSSKNDFSIN
jgi:hypothetical protein